MDTKIRRRNAIQVQQGGGGDLPAGYTRYDWIMGSGSAYINTGITQVASDAANEYTVRFKSSYDYDFNNIWKGYYSGIYGLSIYNYHFNDLAPYTEINTTKKTRLIENYANDVMTFTVKVDGENDVTLTRQIDSSRTDIRLPLKIQTPTYEYIVYSDTTRANKLWHGIPCTNPDGVAGMYDKISETFFSNASSSGSFTVGNDN